MQTAANTTTGTPSAGGDWQRAAGGPKPSFSNGIPHVLARLPDLRAAKQQAPETPRWQPPVNQPPVNQPAPSQPVAGAEPARAAEPQRAAMAPAVEIPDVLKSEFFEPQGLPSLECLWQDGRQWFSKHAKVAMVVIALLASQSLMLLWYRAPAERPADQALQPLGSLLDQPAVETTQLNPVPMETDGAFERLPATGLTSTPTSDEPHLALPRPQPDPISLSSPPRLTVPEEPVEQPKLAAMVKPGAERATPQEQDRPADALSGAPAKPAAPLADAQDIPPWESWSNEKAPPDSASAAVEAAAQATPVLAPPDGSGTIADPPAAEHTASLSADRPSSRGGSGQRPRAVAKLKGTINKPLAEPANERTRRSLY